MVDHTDDHDTSDFDFSPEGNAEIQRIMTSSTPDPVNTDQPGDGIQQGELGELNSPHTVREDFSSQVPAPAAHASVSHTSGTAGNSPNSPNSLVPAVPADEYPHLRGYRNLTVQHAQELYDSAIPPEIAQKHGVYSAMTVDDQPGWAWWINRYNVGNPFPVLVYPMVEPDGGVTGQVKPQKDSVIYRDEEPAKYISPNDRNSAPYAPQLPVVRSVDNPKGVLIVEGVKQALAVDAWAPAEWAIYRICGITGWSRGGSPTRHLKVVRGLDVVVIPDADAATKHQVYKGAVELGNACESRRANSVRFVRIAGFGSTGIDDQLGRQSSDEDRRELIEDFLAVAHSKPADKVPKALSAEQKRKAAEKKKAAALAESRRNDVRPVIHIGEERMAVIAELDRVLRENYDGMVLFRHGESLGQLIVEESDPKVVTVTQGSFSDLISLAAITVAGDEADDDDEKGCTHPYVWPDTNTLKALESRYRSYQPLVGVSAVPVIRPDGSFVTEPGYDLETGYYVSLSDDIAGIEVPESPTDAEVAKARNLLIDDLFVDFLLKDRSDMAHAVAALLSPFVRPIVRTCPGFVVNGLQPGVGKGLVLTTISTVVSGAAPEFAMLPDNEDEMRKTLTAYLHAGKTSIFFDETHKLASKVLNGCLTAESWSDRKLGVTERIEMPNVACMYFAGNQIEISGDMARRAVQLRLHTDEPDPQNRDGFKHELPGWATENRRELLQACLTLIRAWYNRGKPKAQRAFRFGSFEQWQDVLGGILEVAGIPGFLEDMDEQRQAADFDGQCWIAHLSWLAETFSVGQDFVARDASEKMLDDPDAETPPELERLLKDSDPRALGKAWATQADRWRAGLRIVNRGTAGGHRTKWAIEKHDTSTPGEPSDAAPASHPAPAPAAVTKQLPDGLGRPMPVISDLDEEAS